MKGIFHVDQSRYDFVKSLGYDHVEVSFFACYGGGGLLEIASKISAALDLGLTPIVHYDWFGRRSSEFAQIALPFVEKITKDFGAGNVVWYEDEPNQAAEGKLRREPWQIMELYNRIKKIDSRNRFMICVSPVNDVTIPKWRFWDRKSYKLYRDCADLIAVDFYRTPKELCWHLWRHVDGVVSASKLIAIPALKKGPEYIDRTHEIFKRYCPMGYMDYSFGLNGGEWSPDRKDKNLADYPEWMDTVRKVNST